MADDDLDPVDEDILARLQGDARNVTTAEIGEAIGLSASTVASRIARLEDDGVITGYWTGIDYARIGYDQHLQLVGTVPDVDAVLEEVLAVDGVVRFDERMTDEANVSVHLVGRSQDAVEDRADHLSRVGMDVERTRVVERSVHRPGNVFGRDPEPRA